MSLCHGKQQTNSIVFRAHFIFTKAFFVFDGEAFADQYIIQSTITAVFPNGTAM